MTEIISLQEWLEFEQSQDHLLAYSIKEATKRLEFGTYVGEKLDYLFIATPKAACSTMKWILADLENQHVEFKHCGRESNLAMIIHGRTHSIKNLLEITDIERTRILSNPDVIRFWVVRNPYARFVSGWSDKVRQKEPSFQALWQQIGDYFGTDPQICPSFAQFARWMVETQSVNKCNAHWRSMTHLLMPDLLNYTHILHTENLESELEEVIRIIAPHRSASELLKKHRINESLPVDWRACYNEELAEMVSQFYHEDFKHFGYSLDSWRSTTKNRSIEEELIALKDQFSKYEASAIEAVRVRNDVIFELTEKKKPTSIPLAPQKDKKAVLVLGDGHARIFKRENWLNLTPDWSWKTVLIENARIYGSNCNQTTTDLTKSINTHLAKVIIFCLGEADVGLYLWKAVEKQSVDLNVALKNTANNYCKLIRIAEKKAHVVVISSPLPTVDSTHRIDDARSSIKASLTERTELTSLFNSTVEAWCIKNAITYINLDALSKGPDNLIHSELRNPKNYRYNPPKHLQLLKKQLLPVLKKLMG